MKSYKSVLNEKSDYSENDIFELLLKDNPSFKDSSLKWILYQLEKNNEILKVGIKRYTTKGNIYLYDYESVITNEIDKYLYIKYPNIKIVVWESRQFNEWINLLLSKNIIFIEVEKGFEEIVFSSLRELFIDEMILLNPNEETINRYIQDNLIVIKTLFSRSPVRKNSHSILLEKIIVDVIADNYMSNILGSSEIENIILGIKNNYVINIEKMITYGKRRNVIDKLNDIWGGTLL